MGGTGFPSRPHAPWRRVAHSRSCRCGARGFTLLHGLVALALLAAFAIATSRLVVFAARLPAQAAETQHARIAFDAAVEQLRADVWAARSVTTGDGPSVRIDPADGSAPAVTWQVADNGAIVRSQATTRDDDDDARPSRRWPGIGRGMTFEWDGTALTVSHATGPDGPAGRIVLPAHAVLAEREGAR